MFRTKIAEWLLRSRGFAVWYVVRRIKAEKGIKGTTLLTTKKLKAAREKYRNVRTADTDTVTVNIEARIAQRHGTVKAKGAIE